MKPASIKIRHAICTGCGRKKFVFVGDSDFCGDCVDEYLALAARVSDPSNREIIPGYLSDMHDCRAQQGVDACVESSAFQQAQSRREQAAALTKQKERAEGLAYSAATAIYQSEFERQQALGHSVEIAGQAAQRAATQTYSVEYQKAITQPLIE